jgi:hypothetical protein
VGADIDPAEAHNGNGGQGEGAAAWPEPGKGGGAQSDGHAGMPGQVSEPGGFAAAAGVPASRLAGRDRCTMRLATFDSAQALVPPARRRPASSRSPASHAALAAVGTAPRVPSCMTTHAGG